MHEKLLAESLINFGGLSELVGSLFREQDGDLLPQYSQVPCKPVDTLGTAQSLQRVVTVDFQWRNYWDREQGLDWRIQKKTKFTATFLMGNVEKLQSEHKWLLLTMFVTFVQALFTVHTM